MNPKQYKQYLSSYIPSPVAVKAGTHDQKLVGTGPFRYKSWGCSDHSVVMKNGVQWTTMLFGTT